MLVLSNHHIATWNLEMWTPLGPIESGEERCPDFRGEIIHVYTVLGPNESVQYRRGVLISGCPHLGVPLYVQCILAYLNLDYPNPRLSELQINEIHRNFSVQ